MEKLLLDEQARQARLETERKRLTEEQREIHDRFVALLHANETYTTELAIKGAQAIYGLDGTKKLGPELRHIALEASLAIELGTKPVQESAKTEVSKENRLVGNAEHYIEITEKRELERPQEQDTQQGRSKIESDLRALSASHDRRHHGADYSALPKPEPEKNPLLQEFKAAAREVTQPNGASHAGGSSNPPQGPAPMPPSGSAPPPPPPSNAPLSANEVLQRFGNPLLLARHQEHQQRRDQDAKSAPTSADPATRSAAQSSSFEGKPGMLDFYMTKQQQKRAEEERAARVSEQEKSRTPGGRAR